MAKFTIIRQKQGSLCFKVRNVFFQDSVFRFKYIILYLQPIIAQYFISNKSEIWS